MPMLPDPAHMDIIDKACISAFEAEEPVGVFSLCESIMDDPKLPMHCPYHHYLIPAVLLTAASKISGETEEMLQKRLKTARERAGTVPGGCCGQFGCCGAAWAPEFLPAFGRAQRRSPKPAGRQGMK